VLIGALLARRRLDDQGAAGQLIGVRIGNEVLVVDLNV